MYIHRHTHKMCIWFCGFELKKGLYIMTWVWKCTYACGGVLLSWNDAVWLRGLYILNPVVNLLTILEQQAWIWERKKQKTQVQHQHTRELISTQKTQSTTTTKTWVTYGKHVNTKYINSILQVQLHQVHREFVMCPTEPFRHTFSASFSVLAHACMWVSGTPEPILLTLNHLVTSVTDWMVWWTRFVEKKE